MSLRNRTLSVERRTGSYVSGTWTPDAPEAFMIKASVQPANGREMELLPENRRNRQTFKLFTDTELKTARPSIQNADRVTIDGSVYEVLIVNPWQNSILNHYEVIVSLEEPAEMPA